MIRLTFATLASLMCIAICAALPKMSHAQAGKWTKKADMPTARQSLSTSVVNGKIYAIGGWDGRVPFRTVEEYDPATDTWKKKKKMPTARQSLSTSVVNGKIYAIGGSGIGLQLVATAPVEEYDPALDIWTKKAKLPRPRTGLSASAVNGKIYAIGGVSAGGPVRTNEEYDPATNTWTRKRRMGTARFNLSTSVVDGKIYAIGGDASKPLLSIVEVYDPATDTWERKANMPTPRGGLTTSVVDGKIYAIGGNVRPREALLLFGQLLRGTTVEVYDPKTDTWNKAKDMPTPRSNLSSRVVNGKIYAIGGQGGKPKDVAFLPTVEEYDPAFGEFQSVNPARKLATIWGEVKARSISAVP